MRKLQLEPLESRQLPAVSLTGSVLTITGEFGINGAGDYTIVPELVYGGLTQIVYVGTSRNDSYANLTSINDLAFGAAGNDRLFPSGTGAHAELHGGEGNDLLNGRAAFNELWGDGGADLLLGVGIKHRDAQDR